MSRPACKCGELMEAELGSDQHVYICVRCGRFWVRDFIRGEWRFLIDEERGYHEA